jgi:hypothetical protein
LSPISECSNVLQEHVSGSNDPYGVCDVEPNSAALTLDALTLSCVADVLARETGRDRVDLAAQFFPARVADVTDIGSVREPVRHYFAGCLVDLSDHGHFVAG